MKQLNQIFYKMKSHFYSKLLLCISLLGVFLSCKEKAAPVEKNSPWDQMEEIISQLKEPAFADRDFNVLDFGAVADGTFDNTEAFRNAVNTCNENGGGRVVVPAGQYFSGPIHLKSNVNFHLEKDSEIIFSTNPLDYYPLVKTSFEGIELMNYSPLVYAYQQKNIAITGEGTLNGQANESNWWTWKGSKNYGWEKGMPSQLDSLNLPNLMEIAKQGVPVEERVYGTGRYLRPNFLEPFECENVLIKGITIINAPFWIIHPMKSNNVIVDGVTVNSHGPNNDGCDPEYSKNVWIKNSLFNTGDDCIAIKSGRDDDGRRVNIVSENIVVQNCQMIDGHGGVVMGSEISSGVRNVFVEDCKMDSPNLDRAIRIKTNSKRGGTTENIYVRNLEIGQVRECVLKVNMFYGTYNNQTGDFIPTVKNIYLENITVKDGGKFGILAKGYEQSPINGITFRNVSIEKVEDVYSMENVINVDFIDTYINGSLMQDVNF